MMSAIKNDFHQGLLDPKGMQLPAAMLCVPSKIQIRQWFEDYCSKISCLDCTIGIVGFYYTMNFARCLSYIPLGVYKPLS